MLTYRDVHNNDSIQTHHVLHAVFFLTITSICATDPDPIRP